MNLITGATGHIGNVLARELVRRGERVRALVLPGDDLAPLDGLDIEIVYGDVLDSETLQKSLVGVDFVFHLAGIISISNKQDNLVHTINVEGTRKMMEAALAAKVRKVVYTSSIHAFKRMPHGVTIDETTPIDPAESIAAYDHSKAEATLMVLEMVKEGLPAVIACPTGVIGPYDFKQSELGELFNDWILHKVNMLIEGSYDFVDVRDVVNGLILAREKGKTGQIYILSGQLIRVSDLWRLVKELVSYKSIYFNIPLPLAKFTAVLADAYYRLFKKKPRFTSYSIDTLQSNAVISNEKARSNLGYTPRSLRTSILDTINWWKERIPTRKLSKKNGR
jgi:dihydroflavonol-4-reductase